MTMKVLWFCYTHTNTSLFFGQGALGVQVEAKGVRCVLSQDRHLAACLGRSRLSNRRKAAVSVFLR